MVYGLTGVALAATFPVATVWVFVHLDAVASALVSLGRRLRLIPAEQPRTWERPLERLAADLRRLSAALREVPRGMSHVRRTGLQLAYDDTLVKACRALEVPQFMADLPLGIERDVERLRIELALEDAGLRFRPVAG